MRKAAVNALIYFFLLLIGFVLVSCSGEIQVQADYGISLKGSEQKGRYVILDIGFDDSIAGNSAAVSARISLENAETPTQEAFDLFGNASNDVSGNLHVSEQAVSKVLAYVPKPGDEIRVTIEVDGKETVLRHATNPSIEYFEVDDGFYEAVSRKLITTPYFNYTTGVHIPSEGISIGSGVLTEGALRGVDLFLSGRHAGGATVKDITKPNDYTVANLSVDVEEFRSRLTAFLNDYWINSFNTKKLDANIQFGTFVSLEQYLNGTYTGAPFNFRNTYINDNVHLEYEINVDGTEEFGLSIRDGYNFSLYYIEHGKEYTPQVIYFTNLNNIFCRYEFDDSQKVWIRKVGDLQDKYESIESLIPENYSDAFERIQDTITFLGEKPTEYQQYLIHFNGGNEAIPDFATKSVTRGFQYGHLPEISRQGYKFDGWWTGENGTGRRVYSYTLVPEISTTTQTLYAKWILIQYIGPTGGYVFYDKGYYSDGWQYLERAPRGWSGQVEDPYYVFGYHRINEDGPNLMIGTATGIGSGKTNTEALVAAMGNAAYTSATDSIITAQYAAKVCTDLIITNNGIVYDDWFLPSKDELKLMWENRRSSPLDQSFGYSSWSNYWSSSESNQGVHAWSQYYGGNEETHQLGRDRSIGCRIRPIRAF